MTACVQCRRLIAALIPGALWLMAGLLSAAPTNGPVTLYGFQNLWPAGHGKYFGQVGNAGLATVVADVPVVPGTNTISITAQIRRLAESVGDHAGSH